MEEAVVVAVAVVAEVFSQGVFPAFPTKAEEVALQGHNQSSAKQPHHHHPEERHPHTHLHTGRRHLPAAAAAEQRPHHPGRAAAATATTATTARPSRVRGNGNSTAKIRSQKFPQKSLTKAAKYTLRLSSA